MSNQYINAIKHKRGINYILFIINFSYKFTTLRKEKENIIYYYSIFFFLVKNVVFIEGISEGNKIIRSGKIFKKYIRHQIMYKSFFYICNRMG